MSTQGTIADADGDIAALVYASGDRPDLVLRDFAKRLADAGHRVCGLIQLRDRSIDATHGRVMVLDGQQVQVVEVARGHDIVGDSRCRLDGDWLDRMGRQVNASIRRGVDAVIVNRFGPLEVKGAAFVMRSWPPPRPRPRSSSRFRNSSSSAGRASPMA